MSVPRWIEAVLRLDKLALQTHRGVEILRDEVLMGWTDPSVYDELMDRAYTATGDYLPGGRHHMRGLFRWERAALEKPPFPRGGRLLLGAAGGGRELPGLTELGFEVVAFEPNLKLEKGAEDTARTLPNVRVLVGSYADLIAAEAGDKTRLQPVIDAAPYDAVILGWASLTHLVQRQVQVALLRAIRRLAPSAPVFVSFFLRPAVSTRELRVRRWIRPVLSAAGAPYRPEDGVSYVANGAFVYRYTVDEMRTLAQSAGYRIEWLEEADTPHAVLVPS